MWTEGKTFGDAIFISFQEGGLYKLKGHSNSILIHNTMNSSELWNRIFFDLHYKDLPIMRNMVT
jgi:hypothetical protein